MTFIAVFAIIDLVSFKNQLEKEDEKHCNDARTPSENQSAQQNAADTMWEEEIEGERRENCVKELFDWMCKNESYILSENTVARLIYRGINYGLIC